MAREIKKFDCDMCTPETLAVMEDADISRAWTSLQLQYLEAIRTGEETYEITNAGYWVRRELQKRELPFQDNTDFAIQTMRLTWPTSGEEENGQEMSSEAGVIIQAEVDGNTYTMWINKGDDDVPYAKISELPKAVREALPAEAQTIFMNVANSQLERGLTEQVSIASAWGALKNQGWEKGDDGKWSKVEKAGEFSITGEFTKFDSEQQLVFGWANVSKDEAGNTLVDSQGDTISPHELEKAAYDFVLEVRKAGEMHQRVDGIGTMVESVMLTLEKQAAMGIPEGSVPEGWWVGFKVAQDVFDKVKSGEYTMFSIGGRGIRSDYDGE